MRPSLDIEPHNKHHKLLLPVIELVAQASRCPNAMIRVWKNMLGIQGHPEFSADFEYQLMLVNSQYLDNEQLTKGIKSLELPVHSSEAAEWMVRFLKGR